MNVRHLEFLRLIIEAGTFEKAAHAAGVSQSAITQAMQALEKALGFALFECHGRRRVPTAKAEAIARAGYSVNTALREVERAAKNHLAPSSSQRPLRAGLAAAAGLLFGTPLLEAARRHDSDATLQITSGPAPPMIQALVDGELDMVIAPKPRRLKSRGLSSQVIYTSHPVIYCRQGHPLAHAATLEEIARADWAVAGQAGTPGNVIEEAFRVRRLAPPRIAVQCTDYHMLLKFVSASDLLCVISHPALVPSPNHLGVQPLAIREGLPHYDVCLFWPTGRQAADQRWEPVIDGFLANLTPQSA